MFSQNEKIALENLFNYVHVQYHLLYSFNYYTLASYHCLCMIFHSNAVLYSSWLKQSQILNNRKHLNVAKNKQNKKIMSPVCSPSVLSFYQINSKSKNKQKSFKNKMQMDKKLFRWLVDAWLTSRSVRSKPVLSNLCF